jgi:glutamate synthase domain-containing protein 1
MCGIAGYWDKSRDSSAPIGSTILDMLRALDCRGPDSAGVALFHTPVDGDFVLQVKLGENGRPSDRVGEIIRSVAALAASNNVATTGAYLRMTVDGSVNPEELATRIEAVAGDVEVVSMGCSLEIVKQVGSPDRLEETFRVAETRGSHGIGHTRLSTESKVDLSHSQPFWAHGYPDLAIVHNGHITNYHRMRRLYEQSGVRFYTKNDSEIIAVYVAEGLGKGLPLEEVLRAALDDLDGSFSCLVATADAMGFVKDSFAHKPLLFAESGDFVMVATEEIAIRAARAGQYDVREAQAREVRVWRN